MSDKLLAQVEFYFGDANLPRDKFMQERIKEDDGWVNLETICSFTRMKALGASAATVVELIRNSKSQLVEVSEDGMRVRRVKPLPEAMEMASLYVKGFPQEATLEQLQAFFQEQCPADSVQAVWMRRVPISRIFKGSVFLDLASQEQAQQVAAMSLKYADKPLLIMSKAAYLAGKEEEKKATKKGKAGKKEKTDLARDYLRGCLLKLELPSSANLSHQAIRTAIGSDFPVAYVDCFGDAHWVRFKEPIAAQALAALPQIVIGDRTIVMAAVSEEEEAAYFARLAEKLAEAKKPQNSRPKRSRDQEAGEEEEESAKLPKVEAGKDESDSAEGAENAEVDEAEN